MDLSQALADRSARGETAPAIDLRHLSTVTEHTPEDMTVTAEAGITLAALQARLGRSRQWLPVDPPHPESLPLAELLAKNASGPRRFGYGTIREHLIGLTAVLADGRVIRSGGKVVKNVAGYDLCKLFVGSHGSLGVIVEASFKLRPLPEAERFVAARCDSLPQVAKLIGAILDSELTPVVLDWHNRSAPEDPFTLIVGFAGSGEEVEWQINQAASLGIAAPADLRYEEEFWRSTEPARISVLPSRLAQTLSELDPKAFVARAGNGVIFYRGDARLARPPLPLELTRRVKDTFDPKHIFPELPL